MSKRTDIYRPSAIVPDEYYDIAFLPHGDSMGDCMARIVEIEKINKHMAKTGGHYAQHEHGGSCMVCGNVQAMTHVIFYHEKSNTYIRVGAICADKIGLGYDKNGLSIFKRAMKEATEFRAGKAKAQALLAGWDLSRAWDLWSAFQTTESGLTWEKLTRGQQIMIDMVSKLVKYGSFSEAQQAFLGRLIVQESGDVSKMDARAKARHDERQRDLQSQHVGTVGQRLTMPVTVRFAKYIETQGNRFSDGFTITVMENSDGNIFVWKGKGFDYDTKEIRGATMVLTGTVKDHSERDGVKQTVLTRCKATEITFKDPPQQPQVDRGGVLAAPAESPQRESFITRPDPDPSLRCKICGQPEDSHVHELERWQARA